MPTFCQCVCPSASCSSVPGSAQRAQGAPSTPRSASDSRGINPTAQPMAPLGCLGASPVSCSWDPARLSSVLVSCLSHPCHSPSPGPGDFISRDPVRYSGISLFSSLCHPSMVPVWNTALGSRWTLVPSCHMQLLWSCSFRMPVCSCQPGSSLSEPSRDLPFFLG